MESYCFMDMKFLFFKKSSGYGGGNNRTVVWMNLMSLNCVLKNSCKFYVMYISPPFKIIILKKNILEFLCQNSCQRKLQLFQNGKYFSHDFQSKYNILLMLCTFQETNKFLITVHLKEKLMSSFCFYILSPWLYVFVSFVRDLCWFVDLLLQSLRET